MERLFVYGTLLKDFKHDVFLSVKNHMKFEGRGQLKGILYDLGDYPAYAEKSNTNENVKGEVYQIDNPRKVFDILDEYEGLNDKHPEYSRKRKRVQGIGGRNILSWVYVLNKPVNNNLKKIKGGDYRVFAKTR